MKIERSDHAKLQASAAVAKRIAPRQHTVTPRKMPSELPVIVFEPLHPDVNPPTRATRGAAGYDVRACLKGRKVRVSGAGGDGELEAGADGRLSLPPGVIALVPLGFRARLPDGYEAQLRVRSSIAFRMGLVLPNAPGTIDADYPDDWLALIKNDSSSVVVIEHGERIAQVVLNRFEVLEWNEGSVGVSTDREGGFGSTGRH
jgi:dUTP pyrophosphatase